MNWFFSNNEWTNEWINDGKNERINVNKIGSQNTCHLNVLTVTRDALTRASLQPTQPIITIRLHLLIMNAATDWHSLSTLWLGNLFNMSFLFSVGQCESHRYRLYVYLWRNVCKNLASVQNLYKQASQTRSMNKLSLLPLLYCYFFTVFIHLLQRINGFCWTSWPLKN